MGFNKETQGIIEKAVAKEYETATSKDEKLHRGEIYNTLHEGWAVIREEVEETEKCLNAINLAMDYLWKGLRCGEYVELKPKRSFAEDIERIAIEGMKEFAQVAACARKFRETLSANDWT